MWLCSGTLPNASRVFPQARVINLAFNSLTGSIPVAFNTSGAFNSSLVSALLTLPTICESQLYVDACSRLIGFVDHK